MSDKSKFTLLQAVALSASPSLYSMPVGMGGMESQDNCAVGHGSTRVRVIYSVALFVSRSPESVPVMSSVYTPGGYSILSVVVRENSLEEGSNEEHKSGKSSGPLLV